MSLTSATLASVIDLNHPGHFLTWGALSISLANLVVILTMLALFALALFLPFPRGRSRR